MSLLMFYACFCEEAKLEIFPEALKCVDHELVLHDYLDEEWEPVFGIWFHLPNVRCAEGL